MEQGNQKHLEKVKNEHNNKHISRPETEWQRYQNRYRAIRKVIATSGDGLSCETALKVIYVSDEYNMLYTYFDVEKIHSQQLVGRCDRFEVEPSQYLKSTEVYFDVSVNLMRTQELMDRKEIAVHDVSAQEDAELNIALEKLTNISLHENAAGMAELTSPRLINAMGGKENALKLFKEAFLSLENQGLKIDTVLSVGQVAPGKIDRKSGVYEKWILESS